jgi:hypothetical protein
VAERDVEARLVRGVRKLGGRCWKWVSPGRAGVPDRIVLLPHGVVAFVELKDDGGTVSQVQDLTIREIRNLGHLAYVVRGAAGVDAFLEYAREEVEFMRASMQ